MGAAQDASITRNQSHLKLLALLYTNGENPMRALNLVTLLLVIVGGLNWLLVGIADFDLVATLFGGQDTALATIVYVLVGLSALWQLVPFFKAMQVGETHAEANIGTHR